MAKQVSTNGMIQIAGRVVSALKISVPADATMEQKLQAMLDAFKSNIESHATVTVQYSSTAQCQQLKELHAAGKFVQTVTEISESPAVKSPDPEPDKSPEPAPKAVKAAAKPAAKKVEAAPASKAKAKKALTKTDKKLLENKSVRAVSASPNGAVRDKKLKQVVAASAK